ncbi:MAG: ABC transporter permease [Anaerolineae bacterium]|nr:ABC transporter permease [Anaerolineae bacterium]
MLQETVSQPPRSLRIKFNQTLALLAAFIVMCAIFGLAAPTFLSGDNVFTISNTLATVGISAIGMTLVLITGGVDLSVGSVAALAGVIASSFWPSRLPIWPAVGMGLLSGLIVGLFNGLVITRLRINPLITTLATYSAVRGIAFVISGTQDNQLGEPSFLYIGRGSIAGIPFSLILMLALYLLFALILRYTRFGRNLFAIGGSPEAARLAGINTNRHLLITYVLCGLLSALTGLVSAAQLAAGRPQAAFGLEFAVVAAVVLGGTTLAGGKGTLVGTLIGVIMLRTLDNGLIQLNVSSFWQDVARGIVLLLTVGLDQLRQQFEKSRQRGVQS